MKSTYIIFISILLNVSFVSAQKFNATLATQLQTKLESFNVIKGISACVIIPCDNGVWTGVDGISTSSVNINSDMLFGIGSCTKNFTATILLKLAEDGLLSLDDPISDYLDISAYPNISGSITIRQLLNHTSGLADYTSNQNIMQYADQNRSYLFTNNDILSTVGTPQFSPGTSWSYCNTNFYIAGMIIESVTGMSLTNAYENYIFTPLNLNNIFIGAWETIPASYNFAHGWYFNPYLWLWQDYSLDSYNSYFSLAGAAGCLVTTAEDLARYAQGIFSGQIISQSSIDEMTNFNTNNYGLGCEKATKAGKVVWGHNGCIQGYASRFLYEPNWGISVAILCNNQSADVETYIDEIFQVVVDNYQPLSFSIDSSVNVSCFGGSDGAVYTSASGSATPFTYSWTNAQTNSNIIGITSGNYSVTITDMNGCTQSLSTTISEPYPLTINLSGTNVTPTNPGSAEAIVSGGTQPYLYNWSNGNTSNQISNLSEGTYSVTITDANGCTVTDSIFIENNINTVENSFTLPEIKIFPNPTSQYVYIENAKNCNFTIFTLLGKKVKSFYIQNTIESINITDLDTGIYFLIIRKEKAIIKKITITKE